MVQVVYKITCISCTSVYTVLNYVICGSVTCSFSHSHMNVFLTDISSLPSNNRPIVHVREGEHFILSCSLPASVPAITVQWQRRTTNVSTLSNNNRFSIYSNETTSLLIVSYFDTSDAETYRCLMSNDLVPDITYNQAVAEVGIGSCDCVCLSVYERDTQTESI